MVDSLILGNKIIEGALHFAGLYEVKNNTQWADPTIHRDALADEFLGFLKSAGWYAPLPYCAAFGKASWLRGYAACGAPGNFLDSLRKRLTLSVMQDFENFQSQVIQTKTPLPGSIGLYQLGVEFHGHAVLVAKAAGGMMATIEGNTSPQPGTAEHDREGDGVYKRTRAIDFTPKRDGLWLKGFLQPMPWEEVFAPAPVGRAVVVVDGLNLRDGRGVDHEILTVLHRGEIVSVLEDQEWARVRTLTREGYASRKYLKLLDPVG